MSSVSDRSKNEVDEDPFDYDASTEEDTTFVLEENDDTERTAAIAPAARRAIFHAPASRVTDIILVGVILAVVYGLASTSHHFFFSSTPYSALRIDTSLRVLPSYAMQSITRLLAGYVVSLIFSLGYAYLAYRVSVAARVLMLVIDVLQSIPLLSFLPGVVLGVIALFPPGARTGVELAAVLLLFTSMAWNMLLGFYQSLCGIPSDLLDVAKVFKLSRWKRFWTVELPAGAIGLIWNSIISVAGGWFFLISIESFELGNRDFRLPGLGSYIAAAAEVGNYSAILAGLGVIVGIIVAVDFLVWRPLIAWSSKFKYGGGGASVETTRSAVLNIVTRSPLARYLSATVLRPAWDSFLSLEFPKFSMTQEVQQRNLISSVRKKSNSAEVVPAAAQDATFTRSKTRHSVSSNLEVIKQVLNGFVVMCLYLAFFSMVGIGTWRAINVMRHIGDAQWVSICLAALCTFGRVFAALSLSLLWTVPVGIAIGRNPAVATLLQPVVQIAASIPATGLFPFVLIFLAKLGGGLQIGSIALMMLGTMWYVLFNVIAGTQAIPPEFFDVDSVYNRGGGWIRRWRTLVLPGIFPYLITGIVTAVGGAWNASIVSEYVVFRGGIMKTHGLGALISEAAATGNYPLLLAGTLVMSVLVLLTNRFVWGPLYRLAETKYRM